MYCECCGAKISKSNKVDNKKICRDCFEIEKALKDKNLEKYFDNQEYRIDFKIKKRIERETRKSDDEEDLW